MGSRSTYLSHPEPSDWEARFSPVARLALGLQPLHRHITHSARLRNVADTELAEHGEGHSVIGAVPVGKTRG